MENGSGVLKKMESLIDLTIKLAYGNVHIIICACALK